MTVGILSGRGNRRDQFGRDNATLLTQLKYANKLGIPLVSGERGKCPVRIRSGSRSDFQIISEKVRSPT